MAMSLEEISEAGRMERREKVQGLREQKGPETLSPEKDETLWRPRDRRRGRRETRRV